MANTNKIGIGMFAVEVGTSLFQYVFFLSSHSILPFIVPGIRFVVYVCVSVSVSYNHLIKHDLLLVSLPARKQ